jgi:F0F1-type ATP synthase assembly protein I
MRYVALVSQLPFMTIAGYGIGYALDYWLGTTFIRLIGLIAGIVGGFSNLVRELVKDTKSELPPQPRSKTPYGKARNSKTRKER